MPLNNTTKNAERCDQPVSKKVMLNLFIVISLQPELTNVCFWYYPPCLREMENCQEKQLKLHKVICQTLYTKSSSSNEAYEEKSDTYLLSVHTAYMIL